MCEALGEPSAAAGVEIPQTCTHTTATRTDPRPGDAAGSPDEVPGKETELRASRQQHTVASQLRLCVFYPPPSRKEIFLHLIPRHQPDTSWSSGPPPSARRTCLGVWRTFTAKKKTNSEIAIMNFKKVKLFFSEYAHKT